VPDSGQRYGEAVDATLYSVGGLMMLARSDPAPSRLGFNAKPTFV
jgi:hypothetical protein